MCIKNLRDSELMKLLLFVDDVVKNNKSNSKALKQLLVMLEDEYNRRLTED